MIDYYSAPSLRAYRTNAGRIFILAKDGELDPEELFDWFEMLNREGV